jgi:hypothetical protein
MDRQRIRVPCELPKPLQRLFRRMKPFLEKPYAFRMKRSKMIAKKVIKDMKATKKLNDAEEQRVQRMYDRASRMSLKGLQEEVVAVWLHIQQQDKVIEEQKQTLKMMKENVVVQQDKVIEEQKQTIKTMMEQIGNLNDITHDCLKVLHDRLRVVETAMHATAPAALAAAMTPAAPSLAAEESLFDDDEEGPP